MIMMMKDDRIALAPQANHRWLIGSGWIEV